MSRFKNIQCSLRSLVILVGTMTQPIWAGEISMLSGVYESFEITGGPKASTVSGGGRYAMQFASQMFWFADALVSIGSMRANPNGRSVDSLSVNVGGGVRYYFDKLSERLSPYGGLGGNAGRRRQLQVSSSNDGYEALDVGLRYRGFLGLRFSLNSSFFVDFESTLFESTLFGTHSVTTYVVNAQGGADHVTVEKKSTSLFGSTSGPISGAILSFGMRI